jgi:hypothetical protein
MSAQTDAIKWHARFTVREYAGDIDQYRRVHGRRFGERLFLEEHPVLAERVIEGNLLLDEGIEELFKLLTGDTATAYSEANARLGVGNGTAAANRVQTALQGGSTAYQAMDTGYPVVGATADHKVTFQATFGEAAANFAWEECTVDNGAAAGMNLNRKVATLGTKSGGSWQLTLEISLT